jgi:hypothetical protein
VPRTHNRKATLGFISSLKPGKKKLIYEESHIARWFHCLFDGKVDEQVACDPFYLGKKQGPKDDDRDAWHLANEGRCGHVVPVFHEENELIEIRALMGAYSDLVRETTRTKNRFKAMFLAEALDATGDAIYHEKERIKELSLSTNRFVATQLFTQLEELEKIKKEYEVILTKGKKKNPLIKKLATIPGFGPVRSHTVAALVCSGQKATYLHLPIGDRDSKLASQILDLIKKLSTEGDYKKFEEKLRPKGDGKPGSQEPIKPQPRSDERIH